MENNNKLSFFKKEGGIFNSNKIFNGIDYNSTAIKSVSFNPDKNEADIVYNGVGNKSYKFPMTSEEFDDLKNAPSKGSWVYYIARRY